MNKPEYLTAQQYAEKLGVSRRVVNRLLLEERIPGAIRFGSGDKAPWMIPADSVPAPGVRGPKATWEEGPGSDTTNGNEGQVDNEKPRGQRQ